MFIASLPLMSISGWDKWAGRVGIYRMVYNWGDPPIAAIGLLGHWGVSYKLYGNSQGKATYCDWWVSASILRHSAIHRHKPDQHTLLMQWLIGKVAFNVTDFLIFNFLIFFLYLLVLPHFFRKGIGHAGGVAVRSRPLLGSDSYSLFYPRAKWAVYK